MGTQDIVQLPHQHIAHFEGNDLKLAIERNFREVANMLHTLQLYEKRTGKPINETVANIVNIDGKVITGMLADKMVGLLNELQLADEAVTTDKIAAEAVTADKIYVNELAAISAYLGTVLAGEIYGTTIRSGQPEDEDYIELSGEYEPLKVVKDGKTMLNIWAHSDGGFLQFYDADDMRGQILPHDDTDGVGLRIHARNNAGTAQALSLIGSAVEIHGNAYIHDNATAYGNLHVAGNLSAGGSKPARQVTENYGERYLYARESPDVRYIIEGRGTLVGRELKIDLDPIFLECIEPDTEENPWLIQITPYGDKRVWVSEITPTYIVVKSDGEGLFFWSLSAVRKGYAGTWLGLYDDGNNVLEENWEDEILQEYFGQEGFDDEFGI